MRLVGCCIKDVEQGLTPYLQDNGLKYLHYVDNATKFVVRNGLEDLSDRIEVAAIAEIATGTGIPPPHVLREQNDLPSTTLSPSPLSFSLINHHGDSLADQIAPDASRWADWTDGLNMLRRDGGHVASKETAGFVQALTEIGLKVKLLGKLFVSDWRSWLLTTILEQICLARISTYPVACLLVLLRLIPIITFLNYRSGLRALMR
jgi:hypothetical protein